MATQTEVGIHLDLSERHVRRLVRQGVLPGSKGHGGYNLDDCRLAYIRYQRTQNQMSHPIGGGEEGDYLDPDAERARLLKEQADAQAMKNEITRREWAPISMIEWAAAKAASQVSAALEAIPQDLRKKFPSLPVPVINAIDREIVRIQAEASKVAVTFDEFMGGDDDFDSEGSDQGLDGPRAPDTDQTLRMG